MELVCLLWCFRSTPLSRIFCAMSPSWHCSPMRSQSGPHLNLGDGSWQHLTASDSICQIRRRGNISWKARGQSNKCQRGTLVASRDVVKSRTCPASTALWAMVIHICVSICDICITMAQYYGPLYNIQFSISHYIFVIWILYNDRLSTLGWLPPALEQALHPQESLPGWLHRHGPDRAGKANGLALFRSVHIDKCGGKKKSQFLLKWTPLKKTKQTSTCNKSSASQNRM